jgi:glycosyltransferase involved in cell wall biosynthesis
VRILVTALATAAQPTGLAVYARMTSDRLAALAPDDIRVVSSEGRLGSGLSLAASRMVWLYTQLDGAARAATAKAVLHLLPELGRTSRSQVIVLHDVVPLVAETTWRQRLYFRTIVAHAVRAAAGVVADSEATRRDAVEILGASADRVVVVHPGVDLERFRLRSRQDTGASPFILAVGSHAPHKRLDRLMRAFGGSSLRSTHQLHIVGPYSQRYTPALLALRDELGLEGTVHFLRYDSPDQLAERYAGADLYASASSYEGFGLPALEALASGTPVVVTDVGAARAYVDNSGVVLPRDASAEMIAQALDTAVTFAGDPELRARARRRAEAFSWDKTAAGLLEAMHLFVERA